MDALALLCNLHASGPETLHLLRRTGVDTLGELADLGEEALAGRLGWGRPRAARFLREATLLQKRLEGERLGPEVPGAPTGAAEGLPEASAPDPEELPGEPGETRERGEPFVPRRAVARPAAAPSPGSGAGAGRHDASGSELRRRLLGTWRELDEEEPPLVLQPAAPPGRRAPAPAVSRLPGLPPEVAALLAAAGAGDLRALAEARPLDLVERTGLGYTRVVRLQGLARRELGQDAPRPA